MEGRKTLKSRLGRRNLCAVLVCLNMLVLTADIADAADPNLVAHWRFDEGSGTTTYDSAGDNDGNITGASWTSGQVGGALRFDGVDDYVEVNDNASLDFGAGNFTISLWFRTTATDGELVDKSGGGTGRSKGYSLTIGTFGTINDGKIALRVRDGSRRDIIRTQGAYNDGDWHHLAAIRKGSFAWNLNIYVDGVDVATATLKNQGAGDISNSYDLSIGAKYDAGDTNTWENFLAGAIDEVIIFGRALSTQEILQLYEAGLVKAYDPSPADGATYVAIDAVLSWDAGFYAVAHDVYFGTTIPPPFKANQSETIYDPCMMDVNTTYYWRIDEHGPGGTFTGDLWSFTTSLYATIPDTLDLQYRARLGINALTRCTNSSEGYRVYWLGELNRKPPILTQLYSSSLSNLYGKFTQSLALCRMATRSTFNTACDVAWKNTITNLFDPGPGPSVTPGVDGGRMLATLAHYYSDDENSTWLTYAQSMVNRSINEFHDKGDWGYFGGSMPQGWQATFHGWILQGLAHYYRVSGDSTTYTMGNKVANFLKSHAQVFDSNGRFLAKHSSSAGPAFHFHHNGNCMEALSEWVLASGDAALASFVNDSYQYAKSVSWPVIGFFPEYINGEYPDWWRRGRFEDCEACSVYDMMLTALNLTRSGGYDYWDDVDMYTRNMNANMQMTNGDWIYDMIAGYGKQGVPGGATDVNVPERVVGDVAGWSPVNGFVAWWSWSESVMHCCLGNAGRAWYHVWANILTYDSAANTLAVNLLLKRFSGYADVASFLPYEGRVEIDVKRTFTGLSVRMPGHVDLATVQCTVNGQTRSVSWNGRYLQTGFVKAGDAIAITFTISERAEQITIAGTTYNLIIRGHTCVSIEPPGTHYPYFEGEHYRTGPVQYKYVQRIVGKDITNMEYEGNCVEAGMQFTPQKLNCKSKGNFVKAHITLPEGFAAEDVALDTPALAYPMNIESEYLEAFVNDYGEVELEIGFDRQSFCDGIGDEEYLDVTVVGSLITGQYFYGADTIRIMSRR